MLRIDNAICRAGDMHSENAQVHKVVFYWSGGERSVQCVCPALELEVSRDVWFVSWWLRVLRRAIKSKRPEMLSDGIIFCMIMPVPILPIWWGISFRDLAGKHYNILRTTQIFPLVTSTFLATWRKTFVDVGFIRTRKRKSGWGCGSIRDLCLSTRLELIISSPIRINVLTLLAITFE